MSTSTLSRRNWLRNMLVTPAALAGLSATSSIAKAAPVDPKDTVKVTKMETFVLKNSWVFVKIHTNVGITGWGEMLKDDAKACAAGAMEVADYLVGQDPRAVVHHWQAIHRGAFYRGGPIKSAISSGIDQALWDITGKCYGVPVYKLLGGPTREKAFVYGTPDPVTGVKAMKVSQWTDRKGHKYLEGNKFVDEAVERFGALRARYPGVDIALDFHG
ncbi:MAG: galactonate dehydratase, partial [Verrucomicrobiae bacterium]|nr:galactonate dehydratase [Verrucomicrobiae bacterium]